jgi:hypothetical protein
MKTIPALLLFGTFFLFGCKAANKLVGTWEGELSQGGNKVVMNQVMNGDGTYVQTMTAPLPAQIGGGTAVVTAKGTWTSTEASKITFTITEVASSGIPKQYESYAIAPFESQKGKAQDAILKWNGNDEFSLAAPEGPSFTLKRK